MSPFSIGSDLWPGLSKLIEEAGEVMQVAGKLLGTGGRVNHWDGTDLRARLQEEIADLMAACRFVIDACDLDCEAIIDRSNQKLAMFHEWHRGKTVPPVVPPTTPVSQSDQDWCDH